MKVNSNHLNLLGCPKTSLNMKEPLPTVENIFQALEGVAKAEEGRNLERKLGYTKVTTEEANQLLETLNKLVNQEGLR